MTVRCLTQSQKQEIFKMYVSSTCDKGTIAKKFNTSVRTIGRVIDELNKVPNHRLNTKSVAPVKINDVPTKADVSFTDKLTQKVAGVAHPATVKVVQKVQAPADSFVDIKQIDWILGNKFINLIVDGRSLVCNTSNAKFEEIKTILVNNPTKEQLIKCVQLISYKETVKIFMRGNITVDNGVVKYKDLAIDNGLTQRIIDAFNANETPEKLLTFFEALMLNPSRRAVNELYGFLIHNDIEITDDGHFYAWKRVGANYKDLYTGTMDNSPGKIVEMPRNAVNEDSTQTCSQGLHVAAKSYIPHYGNGRGKIVKVKVHPRDVVSIPVDYNNAKLRACRYQVMEDVTAKFHASKEF